MFPSIITSNLEEEIIEDVKLVEKFGTFKGTRLFFIILTCFGPNNKT